MLIRHSFIAACSMLLFFNQTFAQTFDQECDEETQDCSSPEQVSDPVKTIYPYRPFSTDHIQSRLEAIHESTNFISNVFEMEKKGLHAAKTKVQPWGGSYWPLYQGMIGNTYQDKDYNIFVGSLRKNLDWTKNVNDFKKRSQNILPNIYELSEEELSKLSPSEKYDILLGDTNFDLTHRVWDYTEKWGNEKKWAFLSSINLPDDYRIPNASKLMAFWEGICHGWAVAAGHAPRPKRTVTVTLPNGKKMPFYPNDIKALVSLMWAHSMIQSNVIFEGNRCNRKNPDRDKHGRYIDLKKDRDDKQLYPRCADVHPGIFHVSMVNLIGVEGRSFVVDINPEAPITNQPVSAYRLYYFNPQTGKEGRLSSSIISRNDYGTKDPFSAYRNPESTHIVGVEVELDYIDWEFPKKKLTNSLTDDKVKNFSFTYDLELDAKGKVVGGQWRVRKKGGSGIFHGKTNQPDFFWVVPRDWRNYFKPLAHLPKWDFKASSLPPRAFADAAKSAHSFIFEESKRYFLESPQCPVFPVNGGEMIKVDCEFRYPRPQPLINVVETLLNESSK